MRKLTRTLVRQFWGLCAFLLIGLAVIVTIGRELAPQVSHYRADLEAALSRTMDVQVTVQSIEASWEGLRPELHLRGLRITSRSGESILAVQSASAELSLLRSLINLQWALGRLELEDIDLGLRQNADGTWSFPGLDLARQSDQPFDINDPLDIFLQAEHIEFRDARFSFDFRTGHNSRVELPHLVLENSGDFHRLRSEVAVDRNRDVLSLIIEAEGDPRQAADFSAAGYLRLKRFELDKALAALPGSWWDGLPEQEWRKGHQLNLELWFDVAAGMAVDARGHINIGELPVAVEESLQMPKRTTARFSGRWDSDGAWKLALRDLSLGWDGWAAPPLDMLLSSRNLGQPVHLQIAELELERWMAVAEEVGVFRGDLMSSLLSLDPRGYLRNLKLSLAGTRLSDLRLRANLDDISLGSWRGAPAVEHLNGYVEASPLSGYLDLASEQGFSMHYPTIYSDPMRFDKARGRVHWQVDLEQGAVQLHSGLLAVSSEAGEGRGYFSLFVPFDYQRQQEELVVQVGLRNSEARFHKQFVPSSLPESLLSWLDDSIVAGKVESGGFVYRGGLSKAAAEQAAVQLFLNVDQASLNYHPEWPQITDASGVLWLDDRRIIGDMESARLFDTQLQSGRIVIEPAPEPGQSYLAIRGRAVGEASDGMRMLRETALGDLLGRELFADWTLAGQMATTVDLRVPLQEGGRALIEQVDVELQSVQLDTGELGLSFTELDGQLGYNDATGLTADEITGNLWQRPVSARIESSLGENQGEGEGRQQIAIKLDGSMAMESLRAWQAQPALAFLEGSTDFQAELLLPYGPEQHGQPRLKVASDLRGVSVELPAPLGKAAEEVQPLDLELALGGVAPSQLRYGDLLQAVFAMRNGALQSAAIKLGDGAAPSLPDTQSLQLSGQIASFDLREWQQALARYQNLPAAQPGNGQTAPAGESLRPEVDLHFGSVEVDGFSIADLQLRARPEDERWNIDLDSETVAGNALLYADASQAIKLDLKHLRLDPPEPEAAAVINPFLPPVEPQPADQLIAIDPASLPAMDVNLQQFSIAGEDYGSWSFQLRPTQTGVVAREINGVIRGGRIVGLEPGQGAELFWDRVGESVSSQFNGRFVTKNLGHVLQQWNQPHLLDSESTQFDVRLMWPGSPAALSLTSLQGDVVMDIERGTFIRSSAEASTGSALLELLAFFNFDTWMRRLRLDFSDLTRAGTAFQSMEGALEFDAGKVYLNTPVVVNSSSSRFQMAGVVDLVNSELDTKLVATVPVGGNITFVAALAGMGLPAVAGMWLISKVFEEQIGKMSSLSFNVTGPLDDPKMEFVRLFDDQAVPTEARADRGDL